MAKKTLEQIKAEIDRREAEKERRKQNRTPSGAAAEPLKYNAAARSRALTSGSRFAGSRMTGSRGHGSQYDNPLAVRLQREEIIVDYLLDEGYASDESSAFAIMSAMSEDWKNMILED